MFINILFGVTHLCFPLIRWDHYIYVYLYNDDQYFSYFLLLRWISTKKVSISRDLLLCSKKSIYTNTDVKSSKNSTYQELDLSREEIQYQNTTIRWLMNLDWCTCKLNFWLKTIYPTCIVLLDILIIKVSILVNVYSNAAF